MRFTKMHGIGNDYVYVNCFDSPLPADPAALAQRVADRHFGIGGDGLILICSSDNGADARMRMFNADGSESEMCGNGLRCVAKYVHDHGIARKPQLRLQTGRGILSVDLEVEAGIARRVRVNMGQPILEAAQIPVDFAALQISPTATIVDLPFSIDGSPTGSAIANAGIDDRMTCVSMGNPHVMFYCRDVAAVPLEAIGPLLENHPVFPRRINVHFVQVQSRAELIMRTWERGSGITLACGTGACAVGVAGVLTGRSDRRVLAHLPGGDLELDWNEAENAVYMTGPATEVFSGEWPE